MWLPATAAACTTFDGALLCRSHQPAAFGLLDVMAALAYGMYLNDNLYQHSMPGIDRPGVLVRPGTPGHLARAIACHPEYVYSALRYYHTC